jgi:hypothetical protein
LFVVNFVLRTILAATALFYVHPACAAARYAVIVGVGEYDPRTEAGGVVQAADRSANLKSPANDVGLISEVLSYYGFDDKNSTILLNADATRDKIINAVKSKLLVLPPGSLAVFYFSGHGSALTGHDNQGEWNDETIVPYDGRVRGQPARDIVDKEIYDWIEQLHRKSIGSVFIFDSCFSGGIARVGGGELKSLPALQESTRSPDRDPGPSLRTGATPDKGSAVVILTASDANEPAQGVLIKDRYQGVFTTALRNALLPISQSPPTKWADVITSVLSALKPSQDEEPIQSPHLYGTSDAPVFDSVGPFSNSSDARRLSSTDAVLSVGSDLGVTEGSIYKLFGAGQVPWRASPTFEAMARVMSTTPQRASLKVLDTYLLHSDALSAVEYEYATPDFKIKVRMPAPGTVDPFDRATIVSGLARYAEVSEADPELVLWFGDGHWELRTASGKQVGAWNASDDSRLLSEEIGRRLADYSRWKRLTAWKRPSVVQPRLDYEISYRTKDGVQTLEGDDLRGATIPPGVIVQLLVENRSLQRIKLDALLLRQDFYIDVCPIGIAEPREELATEPVTLSDFPGVGAWKIIVSDPARNLSLLFLNTESGARSATDSLSDELARLWNGVRSSSRGASTLDSFWSTVDIPFSVMVSVDSEGKAQLAEKRCVGVPQK